MCIYTYQRHQYWVTKESDNHMQSVLDWPYLASFHRIRNLLYITYIMYVPSVHYTVGSHLIFAYPNPPNNGIHGCFALKHSALYMRRWSGYWFSFWIRRLRYMRHNTIICVHTHTHTTHTHTHTHHRWTKKKRVRLRQPSDGEEHKHLPWTKRL